MSTKNRSKTWGATTEALLQKLSESGLTYLELERATGVKRQSLSWFLRGERSLRLDIADRLIRYFKLRITEPAPRRKPAKKSTTKKGK